MIFSTVVAKNGHMVDEDELDAKSIYWKTVIPMESSLPRVSLSRVIFIKSGYFRI